LEGWRRKALALALNKHIISAADCRAVHANPNSIFEVEIAFTRHIWVHWTLQNDHNHHNANFSIFRTANVNVFLNFEHVSTQITAVS
jgi:hypothetical protein